MADDSGARGEGAGQEQPPEDGGKDWKAIARMWEARSKENAEKAKAYDELQERSKTDLEKAQEKAAGYKRQLDALSAKVELDGTRAKVSKATGVPAELIAGDDEESMTAFAQAVARFAKPPSAPKGARPGAFAPDADAGGDARSAQYRALARQVFGSSE